MLCILMKLWSIFKMFKFLFAKKEVLQTKKENKKIVVTTDATDELYMYIEKYAGISLQESKVLVKNHLVELCEKYRFVSFYELLQNIKEDTVLFHAVVEAVTHQGVDQSCLTHRGFPQNKNLVRRGAVPFIQRHRENYVSFKILYITILL